MKRRLRIWIIQTGERLPVTDDVRRMRSGLLARELAARGHRVTWWSSAFDHYSKQWISGEDVLTLPDGITVKLIRGLGYTRNVSVKRLLDHALVASRFKAAARAEEAPDLIVASLPEHRLAYEGFTYARARGIPFLLDLRDRWPWDFLPLLPQAARGPARWLLRRDFALAATLVREADGLVTMMYSWRDWAAQVIGRPVGANDRIYYLGAEMPRQDALPTPRIEEILRKCDGKWMVLFIGAFTTRSCPTVLVEAARQLWETLPDIAQSMSFVLAGDGEYFQQLRNACHELPNVYTPGYVTDPDIAALLRVAKVGVVTANQAFEGVPNKVFTYLSGGLPVVSGVSGELTELLQRESVGFTYRSRAELVEAIMRLHSDDALREQMGHHAHNLFRTNFQSSIIYRRFADYVEANANSPSLA